MTDPYLPPVQTDCCVDLSHSNDIANPVPAFVTAKASGVALIIQKATQGTGFVDPTFAARRQAASQAAVLFGAYHFCDGSDPVTQAKHFLDTVGDWKGLLLAIDAEKNNASQVTVGQVATIVQYVQETTGRYPLLYMGASGPDGNGISANAMLSNCDLWLPEYGSKPICPPGFARWVLHQYTGDGINGSGAVAGIGSGLDRSYFAGTVADLQVWFARAVSTTPVVLPGTWYPVSHDSAHRCADSGTARRTSRSSITPI